MAENDIYDSGGRYEKFKRELRRYLLPPEGLRTTQIKNPVNLRHFKRLFIKLEARNSSFLRRLRLGQTLLLICHGVGKDLEKATRDDIDNLMIFAHKRNKTPVSKQDFVKQVKFLWKLLFPEKDQCEREDETIVPYVVRHLSGKIDKSAEKLRKDRLSLDEFDKLVSAFADDARMQALISLAFESLGRPQELLGRKIKDIELFDNYAKVTISEHGKEGIGILRCIDSFYYVSQWYNQHPMKDDPEAHFFINTGTRGKYQQLKPSAANILIKRRCRRLGINKPITLYSLKRNGVTYCRLRGDSDVDIQHRARWSSTKQLKTYDLSHQDDSFKLELIKRGVIEADEQHKELAPRTKQCVFCHIENGIAESVCSACKRPLDRKAIEEEEKTWKQERDSLRGDLHSVQEQMAQLMNSFRGLLMECKPEELSQVRELWGKKLERENGDNPPNSRSVKHFV
jgi:integrase